MPREADVMEHKVMERNDKLEQFYIVAYCAGMLGYRAFLQIAFSMRFWPTSNTRGRLTHPSTC